MLISPPLIQLWNLHDFTIATLLSTCEFLQASLVGGPRDTFYQFFMPIPRNVTLLLCFYLSDNLTQENMQPL